MKHNTEAVRAKFLTRSFGYKFDEKTKWSLLIKRLKEDEKDKKYFRPRTEYSSFKWSSGHFAK